MHGSMFGERRARPISLHWVALMATGVRQRLFLAAWLRKTSNYDVSRSRPVYLARLIAFQRS